ncbi:hypothetical protein AB0M86_45850 [Streptomyces sp. NPDC051639]|uniref:hypothetical protein n=1 Tax=Streptomyces sp. NPDC051639 TaxID=3155671 RepID=UPI00344ACF36
MTRRTMAERKRRASERDARRESLLVLLSRTRRGVPLTPSEAALMFAHVEVELAEADELRRTVAGQQNAIQAAHGRTAAAEAAIVEAEERLAELTPKAEADRASVERLAAALGRICALARRMRAGSPQGAAAIYADRIEQALANDPNALTPEQTAVHVAFAEAADSVEARLAEQSREHAIALATERRRGDGWKRHALTADARADRYWDAWRNARRRAQEHYTEQQRVRGWCAHWAARTRAAEPALAAERRRANRYRTAWFAARRDRKADRAAMAAELHTS